MVRSRSREAEDEVRNNPLVLACEDTNNEYDLVDYLFCSYLLHA